MALFESYERRIDKINGVLAQYGIKSVEECKEICAKYGLDPYKTVGDIQGIAFENAKWAYTVGAAIALKKDCKVAADAAEAIGIGLQAFCIPGSVAEDRKVGLGHGNLGGMLLRDETKCFCFLAGHESFAAAEGAIGIVRNANKARKTPLRVILNGLGKDAAQIISRINGFTYVKTKFDYYTSELKIVEEIKYSDTERANVRCFGADDVREGVAIMHHEGVLDKAYELRDKLSRQFKVKVDDSEKSPGWKFAEQEIKGIPTRIEIGPKDIEANQAVIVRRDTREKIVVSLDEIETKLGEILETMQHDMLEKARAHRDSHTYDATTYEEFVETINNKPGFVRAMWCGDQACEDKIKEDTTATSRCMPFEQHQLSGTCVCCGKPAKKMVYWGKAY